MNLRFALSIIVAVEVIVIVFCLNLLQVQIQIEFKWPLQCIYPQSRYGLVSQRDYYIVEYRIAVIKVEITNLIAYGPLSISTQLRSDVNFALPLEQYNTTLLSIKNK